MSPQTLRESFELLLVCLLLSRRACNGDDIEKARCVGADRLEPLVVGGGSCQTHERDAFLCQRDPASCVFFRRQIDENDTIDSARVRALGKGGKGEAIDRIGVSHQHDRRIGFFFSDRLRDTQNIVERRSLRQGTGGRLLYGLAVGDGVGEGHADLQQIDALEAFQKALRAGKRRIACRQKDAKGATFLRAQVLKAALQARCLEVLHKPSPQVSFSPCRSSRRAYARR